MTTETLITQLAKAICAGRGYQWGGPDAPGPTYWESYAQPALDFLASDERLVPEGGHALTVEQVEDLRTILDNFGRHSITSDMTAVSERLASTLFPETEPAEDPRVLALAKRLLTATAEHFNTGMTWEQCPEQHRGAYLARAREAIEFMKNSYGWPQFFICGGPEGPVQLDVTLWASLS